MLGLLPLVLLAVPIAELYVVVQVSHEVGFGTMLLLLVGVSIVGVWVAKAAGLGVLRRMQTTVRAGRAPSSEVVDGFLVLVAGLLMVLPGFLTAGVAVVLLLPPTRALVRVMIFRRISRGATWVVGVRAPGPGHRGGAGAFDVDGWEIDRDLQGRRPPDPPDPPGMLGP